MRVVVALGGNALLRRGQELSAENQRQRQGACRRSLRWPWRPAGVHGNGPQVGLLALQGSAYTAVETYPLDVLGAQTEGIDRLRPAAGARQRATVRPSPGHAPHDDRGRPQRPGVRRAHEADRAAVRRRRRRPARGRERLGVQARRRPHAAGGPVARRRSGSSRSRRSRALLDRGCVVICAGGGGIPQRPTPTTRRRPAGASRASRR